MFARDTKSSSRRFLFGAKSEAQDESNEEAKQNNNQEEKVKLPPTLIILDDFDKLDQIETSKTNSISGSLKKPSEIATKKQISSLTAKQNKLANDPTPKITNWFSRYEHQVVNQFKMNK